MHDEVFKTLMLKLVYAYYWGRMGRSGGTARFSHCLEYRRMPQNA